MHNIRILYKRRIGSGDGEELQFVKLENDKLR